MNRGEIAPMSLRVYNTLSGRKEEFQPGLPRMTAGIFFAFLLHWREPKRCHSSVSQIFSTTNKLNDGGR